MSDESKSEIIRKFRERVDQGDLTRDIKVTYRIAGGMPSERVEEEFKLRGNGEAKEVIQDEMRSVPRKEGSANLEKSETQDLLRQIGLGLDDLVPRSEAHFLPDSPVGSVTIEVDGEETTLYFLAEEEDRRAQEKPISPQMTEAIHHLRKVSKRILEETGG